MVRWVARSQYDVTCSTVHWRVSGKVIKSVSLSFLTHLSSSVVRAFAHGAMGHRIDPSWG